MHTVANAPLNVTVLVPWVDPKFAPKIAIVVPIGPELCDRLVIADVVTAKLEPLLAKPETVTTTLPVVAPLGTAT